ncbi:MAG: hypothetical protein HZA77_01460 [Candidatus Schekmanbacteria bacterium]|nr:hypothetical protein [Candidatus Schekmanbacteria bacterium]
MGVNIYVAGSMLGEKAAHKPRDESKTRSFLYYFFIIVVIGAGIFLLTWKEIYGMKLGYDIQQKEDVIKELTVENRAMKMNLMRLASLDKVEKEALENMEFKKPLISQIKIME